MSEWQEYKLGEFEKFILKAQNATSRYRMGFLRYQIGTSKSISVLRSQNATLKDKRLLKIKIEEVVTI